MIKLYTTGCPKCNVLKSKMDAKNIEYETCTDVKELIAKGYRQAPMLEVDGELMDFNEAVLWVNNK